MLLLMLALQSLRPGRPVSGHIGLQTASLNRLDAGRCVKPRPVVTFWWYSSLTETAIEGHPDLLCYKTLY